MPLVLDPNMIGVLFWVEKARAWTLELENGWADEGEGMGGKRVDPYLFIEAVEIMRLPTCPVKLAHSPKRRVNGAVGLPTPVLTRIP